MAKKNQNSTVKAEEYFPKRENAMWIHTLSKK